MAISSLKSIIILKIIIVLLVMLSCTNSPGDVDCSRLRAGEFEYTAAVKGVGNGLVTITRHDSLQVETDREMAMITEYRIEWVNDCRYTLRPLSASINGKHIAVDYSKLPLLTTQVKKVTGSYYVCETSDDKTYFSHTDTINFVKLPNGK